MFRTGEERKHQELGFKETEKKIGQSSIGRDEKIITIPVFVGKKNKYILYKNNNKKNKNKSKPVN